jgi:pimeloyl-ACP methyl ester carboxylesterase
MFRAQMRRILSRPLPREELDAMWAQIVHREGRLRLPATIAYIEERYRFWERWIGALRRLDVPAHVLWAPEDPVAVIAIGELLAQEIPGATFERLEGLGHYPQLEDARTTGEAIARFLSRVGF